MQRSGAHLDDALTEAYRRTFGEYASRLEALQRLTEGSASPARIETATLDVENARLAYNAARDRLANELVRLSATDEEVRRTARLLWERAGRPEGSADRDWRHAELLVGKLSASCV